MKITKYLLALFFTVLFVLGGCREDRRENSREDNHIPTSSPSQGLSLSYLPFRAIGGMSASRGFTINSKLNEKNGTLAKTAAIDFANGSWDNSTNRPKLLLLVKSKANKIFWAEILDSDSYEYVKGNTPSIRINKKIYYSEDIGLSEQKLVIYAFDNSLSYDLKEPNGSTSDYKVSLNFPSLEQTDNGKGYKLKPSNKEDYKLIFSAELDLETVKTNYDNGVNYHFDMNPLGLLLLFDLRNISSSPFNLPSNYLIRVKTNGFSFENVEIDCASNKATHRSIYEYSGSEDRKSYGWDSNGNIDTGKVLDNSKAGLIEYTDIALLSDNDKELAASENNELQESNRSSIYALYVMPITSEPIEGTTKYNTLNITHPDSFGHSATEKFLFKYNKVIDFYQSLGAYRYLTLDVPPSDKTPEYIKNNALWYVAERNVNEAKTGWGDGSNEDCALVSLKYAKGLFTNGSNTFLNGYHLPSRYEWQSIIPYYTSPNYVYFYTPQGVREDSRGGEECKVEIGKAVIENAKSYYETTDKMEDGKYVTYAVRFYEGKLVKDNEGRDANNKLLKEGSNPYISVWRYSYVDNPNGGDGKMMAIYCKVLPANTTFNKETLELTINGKTENFKNKSFFAESGTPKTGVVYREFHACGYLSPSPSSSPSPSPSYVGLSGYYWSSSANDSDPIYRIHFSNYTAYLSKYSDSPLQFAVRPFIGSK